MSIEKVKIRAKIQVGKFTVKTPYILSFNVNRARGQISTFNAKLKIDSGSVADMTGGPVKIYAGVDMSTKRIFTGIVKKSTISPCFDDPHFVILNISGADALSFLQGKKYTRRCTATETTWATIDGVTRKGLKSGKFKYKKESVLLVTDSEITEAPNLVTAANVSKKSEPGLLAPQANAKGVDLEFWPLAD